MGLVLVRAVIREEKLSDVLKALVDKGYQGATVYRVMGMGGEGGVVKIEERLHPVLIPRVVVEVIADEKETGEMIKIITESARTGKVGDGRIFVIPTSKTVRIRTGEEQ